MGEWGGWDGDGDGWRKNGWSEPQATQGRMDPASACVSGGGSEAGG